MHALAALSTARARFILSGIATRFASAAFAQGYRYDRWGNRAIDAGATQVYGQNPGYSIPEPQFAVDAATNRLGVPAGQAGQMTYDPAGNLTTDTYQGGAGGGGGRAYDAENRMTSAQFVAGQTQTAAYTYDAGGRRVKRNLGAGGEVWQVYGVGGELLAEYAYDGSSARLSKEYGYRGGELLVTAEPAAAPTSTEEKVTPAAATASGSYSSSNGPEKAFDGNASTIWLSGGYPAQWLQLDLGQSHKLTRLRLRVAQSPVGRTVHQVYGGATPASMALIGTLDSTTQDGQWLEVSCGGAEARYVKVLTTMSPSWVAWSEVEVYADLTAKLAPVAATASNSYAASSGPDKATDGNSGTLWNSGGYPAQWIQLDLGSECALSKVRLQVAQYPSGPTVHQVYGGPSPNQLTLLGTMSSTTQDGQWVELPAAAAGVRYVRVTTTANPSSWVAWYEVEAYGRAGSGGGVRWLVPDHLGTPRMVVDQTGSLAGVSRHDYLPFGEELFAGMGGRAITQGYGAADNVRQKFAKKERDAEASLDFFEARYYSSAMGRFTSVDPENIQAAQDLSAPQSWNAYSYVNNNPCTLTDPDGRCLCLGERIKNFRAGYGFASDEAVRRETEIRLAHLRSEAAVNPGNVLYVVNMFGNVIRYDPNDMSRAQIWTIYDQITAPNAERFQLSPDQVAGALQPEIFNAKGTSGLSPTERAKELGRQGESASGLVKNTERIPSATGTAKYRVPDGLSDTTLSEVKNVAKQATLGSYKISRLMPGKPAVRSNYMSGQQQNCPRRCRSR